MQTFDYLFKIGGDFSATIHGMTEATGAFTAKVESAKTGIERLVGKAASFNIMVEAVEKTAQGFEEVSRAGIDLDSQMHDLSAVAGVTGDKLKEIEGYARDSAKAFGTDAGVAVEGYKLLLSQLTPELAKCPEALSEMGRSIQVTSKLMGGDGVAAAQVLTTAMNQYGVSMDDPIKASKVMAQMMNTMAAAGQAGSAELPAISAALQQAGMAAKAANVSFEETNAAIQVLDKAGKKASEGGVALRNTLAILGQGRFLPKETREELERAGVDVMALADKNRTLKERLELLKPVLNDSALFSKLFGMENANAARALVQGTEQLEAFTQAVTGTNSAEEQAAIIMDSYAEKQARIQQQIEDLKISFFNMTGGLSMYISTLAQTLVPISQIAPLFTGLYSVARTSMNGIMSITRMTCLRSVIHAKVAAKGISLAIKSIPFVGWVAIAVEAIMLLWEKCKWFREIIFTIAEACKVLGAWLMDVFKGAIEWAQGAWESIKGFFSKLWDFVVSVFTRIKQVFLTFYAPLINAFKYVYSLLRKWFGDIFDWIEKKIDQVLNYFINLYNRIAKALNWKKIMERGKADAEASWKEDHPTENIQLASEKGGNFTLPQTGNVDPTSGSLSYASKAGSSGSEGSGAGKIHNVSISVQSLVDRMEIHASNLQESAEKIKEVVAEALLGALNDVNLAVS